MGTKELQIGDWVMYDEFIDKSMNHPIKITHLDKDSFLTKYYYPIPLTPEILEKNGFYYGYTSDEEDLASNTIAQLSEDGKGWCWDEGGGSIKVIFPNGADGGLLVLDDQSFDRHLEMVFCETIYVHELQHVLRLCMIEKNIVL